MTASFQLAYSLSPVALLSPLSWGAEANCDKPMGNVRIMANGKLLNEAGGRL